MSVDCRGVEAGTGESEDVRDDLQDLFIAMGSRKTEPGIGASPVVGNARALDVHQGNTLLGLLVAIAGRLDEVFEGF